MIRPSLPETARDSFLKFVQAQTRARHADDKPPKSLDEWKARKATSTSGMSAADALPKARCPNAI